MSPDGPAGMDEPDGLAPVAVVLTQVVVPEALVVACAMEKTRVDVVLTEIGCVAVCRSTAEGEPEEAARVISNALGRTETPVVLIVQRAGQMSAALWHRGAETKQLSAALALDGTPAVVERLLLGQVAVADLPGVVTSVGVGRFRALRMAAGVAKANRQAQRTRAATSVEPGED